MPGATALARLNPGSPPFWPFRLVTSSRQDRMTRPVALEAAMSEIGKLLRLRYFRGLIAR